MQLDRELLKQIATILSAHLGDETQRRAVLEAALFQSPTLDYIEWRGASYPFALRLTRLLIRLEDGNREEPELVTLLREIREQVGYDRQLEIDELIDTLSPAAISELAQLSELALNYIFISYTHHDAEFVDRLRNDLHNRDVKVWIDFIGLKAGTPDWEQAIRDAIRDSRAVLLVASPQARESFYVRDEIAVADMEKKPLYPVWADGEHWIDSVPLGMGRIQYIDARTDNYDAALERLVEMFQGDELETIIVTEQPTDELPADFVPRNPYKGLRAFRAEDRNDFFGRDTLIREFVNALQSDVENANCLAVIGPSGSGKSSVVMAGVIPSLQNGAIPGSNNWLYPHPIVPGTHPIRNLTAALAQVYSDVPAQFIQNSIRQALRSPDKMGLYELVQEKTAQAGQQLVLYIDQFEELFTLTESEDERQQFIDLLVAAATEPDSRLILILSMRADFYDRPMQYPLLGQLLDQRSYSVLPMRLADLQDVIVKPAEQDDVRLQFDDGLVTELVYSVREQTGALPLLQFTLDQLFEHRDGQHLTLEAYDAMGGLQGALAKHAQATYDKLPEADREFVRPLFLRLIEPGQTEQDTTRRRAASAELELENPDDTAALKRVADTFVDARLLLTDSIDGVNTIEVSHEALIREWGLLQRWLDESREDIRFQGELSRDVDIWVRRGQNPDDDEVLYRGTRLDDAETWMAHNLPSQAERAFITASRAAQDARIAAEERRIQELRDAEANAKRARQEAQEAEARSQAAQEEAQQAEKRAKHAQDAAKAVQEQAQREAAEAQERAAKAREEAQTAEQRAKQAQQELQTKQAEAEQASAEAEASTQRAETQRKRARRAITAAVVLIFIAAGVGIFAFNQTNTANRQIEELAAIAPGATRGALLNNWESSLEGSQVFDLIATSSAPIKVNSNAQWMSIERDFDDVAMVLVPAGCFDMGSDDGVPSEQPVHEICFDEPFWIDKYEVTNEQYGSTDDTVRCRAGSTAADQPRNCVNWFEASDHCEAREARLPTEAEWEYAARGPDSLAYPWGNDYDAALVIGRDDPTYGNTRTAPVGSRPGGASWVGALDMSGNVWEWTSSLSDQENFPYPYDQADGRERDTGDSTDVWRVLRGGSFINSSGSLRSAYSWFGLADITRTSGFRCARSYNAP